MRNYESRPRHQSRGQLRQAFGNTNVYQAYRLFLSVAAYQERILEPAVLSLVVIFPLFR
jgi:hypothetical protein